MIQRRRHLRFTLETAASIRVSHVGGQELDSDRPVQLGIERSIHGARAFDVLGERAGVRISRVREERLEMLVYDGIENRFLRSPPLVREGAWCAGGRSTLSIDSRHDGKPTAKAVPNPLRTIPAAWASFTSAPARSAWPTPNFRVATVLRPSGCKRAFLLRSSPGRPPARLRGQPYP
jgi:hypothetical protein